MPSATGCTPSGTTRRSRTRIAVVGQRGGELVARTVLAGAAADGLRDGQHLGVECHPCDVTPGGVRHDATRVSGPGAGTPGRGAIMAKWAGRTRSSIRVSPNGSMAQPVFFVSTAPLSADGLVNCSPKGNREELVVVDERTVAYLDQTGSGVETIAHLRENGRIVVMFCAFAGPPRIVRLHGRGSVVLTDDPHFRGSGGTVPRGNGCGCTFDHRRRRQPDRRFVRVRRPVHVLRGPPTDHGPVVGPEGPRRHPEVLGRKEHEEPRPAWTGSRSTRACRSLIGQMAHNSRLPRMMEERPWS